MLLRAVGGPFTENLFDEIEALTNRASLDVDSVVYDKAKKQASIPLTRYPVIQKKKILRKVTPYKQDTSKKIPCIVTVNNVTDFEVETHFEEGWERTVTLLFGITVKNREVFMSSVGENRGKSLFMLSIKTDSLDIELRDI